jgi:signal recognition particle subunit SRP54
MVMLKAVGRYLRKFLLFQNLHLPHFYRVAATKTPIIFLGVGEHLNDLERFSPQPFISQLLGMGDLRGLMEHMTDIVRQNPNRQKEMTKAFEEGKLSIRDWREQMQNIMSMSDLPSLPLKEQN